MNHQRNEPKGRGREKRRVKVLPNDLIGNQSGNHRCVRNGKIYRIGRGERIVR
jgi:hypothetical protein